MYLSRGSIPQFRASIFATAAIAALLVMFLAPGMTQAKSLTIQEMVDAARAGSVVTVPPGIYRETVYVHKPLTLRGLPGAVIEGGERHAWVIATAHDVTIEGFEMRGTRNWEYWGGITNSHNDVHYDRMTIQNNVLHGASYAAIATKLGTGHKILNNTVHSNGSLGIRVDSGSGHLVAGNRLFNNNLAGKYNSGWEAGGIKVSGNYGGVHDMTIERNEAYNNNGPGIWVDIDGNNFTIRHNTVHHNTRSGIAYELSFNASIHDNTVWENGYGYHEWGWGAGILVQNSSGVSVFNNTVAWNADGITVISQNRGTSRWNNVTDNSVYNNTITLVHDGGWNTYALAWLEDWDGVLTSASSNNRGWDNRYWISTADGADLRFRWGDEAYNRLSDFIATSGENNARYLNPGERDRMLASVESSVVIPEPIVNEQPATAPSTNVADELRSQGTGHELNSVFKSFWDHNGGLAIFGYPVGEALQQFNADSGQLRTVQYLERQRFEHHPELAGTPYEVLIGRLGVAAAEHRGLLDTEPFQRRATGPDDTTCTFFQETGHSLCRHFLTYWQSYGLNMGDPGTSYRESLALFGFPISEAFVDPATGLTSQFFERAIFEHHPNNAGTQHEVLLMRLGADEYERAEW